MVAMALAMAGKAVVEGVMGEAGRVAVVREREEGVAVG